MIVSGEQRKDSAIHICIPILPQTPLPPRLPHNIEQSSLYYTVDLCWLSILNISVCTCWINFKTYQTMSLCCTKLSDFPFHLEENPKSLPWPTVGDPNFSHSGHTDGLFFGYIKLTPASRTLNLSEGQRSLICSLTSFRSLRSPSSERSEVVNCPLSPHPV